MYSTCRRSRDRKRRAWGAACPQSSCGLISLAGLISLFALAAPAAPQAIIGASGDGNVAVVFPTPATDLPAPAQTIVTGMPVGSDPHGVTYFDDDHALVADFNNFRVINIQISTASAVATIDTFPNYSGLGSIAVAPALDFALASGANDTLAVIAAPFLAGAAITALTLPGTGSAPQTQRIVFDLSGRAFVGHSTGISVLDPPYTSIAFTMPLAPTTALAITPDGRTLLANSLTNTIRIYTAPFSAGSVPSPLTIASGCCLRGMKTTSDGSRALVGDVGGRIYSVAAPFGSGSVVEQIPLPTTVTGDSVIHGFEDLDISADGSLAIATGNSSGGGFPAPFIEAPFTAAGATVHAVAVGSNGRGAGAVRFRPAGHLLVDGLESGSTAAWSLVEP